MSDINDIKQITDEEMEPVSGGKAYETANDSRFLNTLGNFCDRYGSGKAYWFGSVGEEVTAAWSKVGVKFVKDDYKMNKYYIDGRQVTQSQAMEHAMRVTGRRISPEDWM